jgi:integrase
MASLYKKPVIAIDSRTGKQVKTKSKKWWGRYRDALGRDCRVPLARDKAAAQVMLSELVQKAERETAGQLDPFEENAKRPLKEHVDEFEQHLRDKGNSDQHVIEVATKVRKIIEGCKWAFIRDQSPSGTQRFLADLRSSGLSVQTSNHYLRAIKQFSRWLVRDRRTNDDVLAHLSMMNVKVDRRHDRRALLPEEFARLIAAAESGSRIESISGADRATMYVLSAWTGYRKKEIGSLTIRSLRLDDDPPTATVEAAYSKRKRRDAQVLHPAVVQILEMWLATKAKLGPDDLLFPVSGKVPGGTERKTAKMMRLDLEFARNQWIGEARTDVERTERENSDFLSYCDETGRFADFHSNRHTFITSMERVRISPRTAQSLARHSDIRLTMGVYTHIELHDQRAAIESLPAPPTHTSDAQQDAAVLRATGTDDANAGAPMVPRMVPRSAKLGANDLAFNGDGTAPDCTEDGKMDAEKKEKPVAVKSRRVNELRPNLHQDASPIIAMPTAQKKVHPRGFEPLTFGSVDRCSIQLS